MAGRTDEARTRTIFLALAGMAAFGWSAAFYAAYDAIELRVSLAQTRAATDGAAIAEDESADAAAASAALAEVEERLARARAALDATVRRRDDLEANIAALNDELAALSRRPSPVPAALETPAAPPPEEERARAESLDAALARLDAAISERSAELVRMRRAHDDLEARLGAADAAYAEADRRLADRMREIAAAGTRLSTLLDDVARLDGVAARRREETQALEAEIGRLRAEAARLRARPARENPAATPPAPFETRAPAGASETRGDGARVIRVTPPFN